MLKYTPAMSSFSVSDTAVAKKFYGDTLGLHVMEPGMGLLQLNLNGGGRVLLYPKPNHVPATFTVLNFEIKNIREIVRELKEKGVVFERYTGEIQTDAEGVSENGKMKMAWFKDPSGNIIALLEIP